MNNIYKTERLILKMLNEDEAQLVLDYYIRNKEFLAEWESRREEGFYTLEVQRDSLFNDVESHRRGTSLRLWVFKKEDESKVIGCVSFQNIVRSIMQSCISGYKSDISEAGKGYMTEALHKAIEVVFTEYDLHRVEAPVMPKNKASIKVLKKLGFREEGITKQMLKVNGVWEDHIRWSLLNPVDEKRA